VDKTFVLFGLKGGDSQGEVEATLRESGYSPLDCKIDPEDLTSISASGLPGTPRMCRSSF
jgi:hypothetical protein